VSRMIREEGGYQLMPEWGTKPANHYLPRRKVKVQIQKEELNRVENPLKDENFTKPSDDDLTLEDSSWI